MGGRAGDAMRLASSSSSSISTLLLSFTTLSLLLVITEAGTHLDEPWFRWRDGNVNFYFKVVAKIASFLKVHNVDHCYHATQAFFNQPVSLLAPCILKPEKQIVIIIVLQDMTNADRRVMRNMMRMIEQRTCLKFREQRGPLVG